VLVAHADPATCPKPYAVGKPCRCQATSHAAAAARAAWARDAARLRALRASRQREAQGAVEG